LNVWAGIADASLVGPHVWPRRLTGDHNRALLLNGLPDLLEDVPLVVRECVQFMHDGAPAHFSRVVRDVLNSTYHNRRIGREGPTAWTPSSSDLHPLDFCLWGHLKALVYAAPVHNVETLHQRVVNACQAIRNYPRIFQRTRQSKIRCVQECVKPHGGHFQHFLLMRPFSSVSRKEVLAGPYLYEFVSSFWYVELIPKVCPHISDSRCIYGNIYTVPASSLVL
jgi:hypothetical protein